MKVFSLKNEITDYDKRNLYSTHILKDKRCIKNMHSFTILMINKLILLLE